MAELTTSQLIKIIIGIFVVVVVVLGIFLFFRGTVIDFFKNLFGGGETGGGGASRDVEEEEYLGCFEKDGEPPVGAYYYENRGDKGVYYYEKKQDGWYYKFGESKSEIGKKDFVKESLSLSNYIENVWRSCEKDGRKVILENGIKEGAEQEDEKTQKTYEIDRVGFKIEGNIEFDEEILKIGLVEFIIISEENCDGVEYQIWKDKTTDKKVEIGINLERVNFLLNSLAKGKYHVDCYCLDDTGKRRDHKTSKNLEIK